MSGRKDKYLFSCLNKLLQYDKRSLWCTFAICRISRLPLISSFEKISIPKSFVSVVLLVWFTCQKPLKIH